MPTKTTNTFWVRIYIAGDPSVARATCRKFCSENEVCVTVTEVQYIYAFGEEHGIMVEFINYAKHPKTTNGIVTQAELLAARLMRDCSQKSYSIMTPVSTTWYSKEERP